MKITLILAILLFLPIPVDTAYADPTHIILHPSDLIRRGNDHLKAGEITDARRNYVRALKTDLTAAQQANAYNGLCIADIREEQWDQAIEHCNTAIDLVPHNWRYYNNRGNVYLGLGEYEKAMQEYEKGLRFAPKSITIRKNMALTQSRAGTEVTSQNDR